MNPRVRAFYQSDLRVSVRDGEQLLLTLGLPIMLLVFFSLVDVLPTGGAEPVDFLAPGVIALALLSVAFVRLAIGVGFDRGFGAIKRLAITPLRASEFIAAKTLTTITLFAGQLVVLSAVGAALGWRPSLSPFIVASLLGGLVTFSALAFVLASRFEGLASLALANALYVVLLLLSGLVVALEEFPGWLSAAVKVLPSTAVAALIRSNLDGAAGPSWAWIALVLWLVASLTAAVALFRWE